MFKGYPNYITYNITLPVSNMFSFENCKHNLHGDGFTLNQPAPNTSFQHKSFYCIACQLRNKYLLMSGRHLIWRISSPSSKKLRLTCRCNSCSSDCLIARSLCYFLAVSSYIYWECILFIRMIDTLTGTFCRETAH